MFLNSTQILSEEEVLKALDYESATAITDAQYKGLISNGPARGELGFALCLYHTAEISETGLPSVLLPHSGGMTKRLQFNTCPPRFSSFFGRWAAIVPNIKGLPRQHTKFLGQAICSQVSAVTHCETDKSSPCRLPVPYSTSPEVQQVVEQISTLAYDISRCRSSRTRQPGHARSMPEIATSFTNFQALQLSMPEAQVDSSFEYLNSASPYPLLDSPQSLMPASYSPTAETFYLGSRNDQNMFVGGFMKSSVTKASPEIGRSSYMAFPIPQLYKMPSPPNVEDSTPTSTTATTTINRRTFQLGEKVSSTRKTAPAIGANMPASEIIDQLCSHGCRNLSNVLDPSAISTHPVSRGGFGEVYSGKLRDGTSIALKTLTMHEDYSESKHLKNAARELYTWSKCKHPNVASLLGLVEFGGRMAMVSRWMDNGNLRKYIKSNPRADRFSLCIQISGGLEYLHSIGIVHGDLKGPNVLISSEGTPVLIDFGNASLSDSTLQFTQTATKHDFTPRWTAPELLHNEKPSFASDVYALGMTILEAFTGEVPYFGVRDNAIMFAIGHLKELPERPIKQLPEAQKWSDMLWQLLKDCWQGTSKERPKASEVQEQLQNVLQEYNEFNRRASTG